MAAIKGNDLATGAAKRFLVGKLTGTISDGVADDTLVAALLSGPTAGRIHSIPIPPPDQFPFPLFAYGRYGTVDESGPIGRGVPTAASTVRLQLRAICEGFDDTIVEEAAGIANQLLDGRSGMVDVLTASGALNGTYYVECTRESELLLDPEPEDNIEYQEVGGIYAFYVSRVG